MQKKYFKRIISLVLMAILLLPATVSAYSYNSRIRVNNQRYTYNYRLFTNNIMGNRYKTYFNGYFKDFIIPGKDSIKNPVEDELPSKPIDEDLPIVDTNDPENNSSNPSTDKETDEPNKPIEEPSNISNGLSSKEMEMVKYVNQARAEAGLRPLEVDSDLSNVARIKSKDMKDNNYFSHTSPTYGSPFQMMSRFGIKYRSAAENIAINSSVRGAHNAFMNSTGHRNNILNPNMTHIGIGIVDNYYTQMFIQK
ncbi:MAG: sporulation protein [Clostridiales bacterium]|nr:sporulation protein [Clostridiales bacterium]